MAAEIPIKPIGNALLEAIRGVAQQNRRQRTEKTTIATKYMLAIFERLDLAEAKAAKYDELCAIADGCSAIDNSPPTNAVAVPGTDL